MSDSVNKRRVAVFISGRGSNMGALIAAAADRSFPAAIVLAISDRDDAKGLELAQSHGIVAISIPRKAYHSKRAHELAISEVLAKHDIEIICLAGFMRLLSGDFLAPWTGRIINIHPSLLPLHKGLDTHQKALDGGDETHGCTVHHVTEGMDEGPIIAQASIDIEPGDTAETLALRVLVQEHLLYPKALAQLIAQMDSDT